MARSKTLITDFRDLPEVDVDEIASGRSLAAFLTCVVMVASIEGPNARVRGPIRCRCRPRRRACPGAILIARHSGFSEVQWRCSDCEFNGVITHWEGSTADQSERPLDVEVVAVARPRNQVPTSLVGRWHIEQMEVWGTEAIDLLGPGCIEFANEQSSLRFVAVEGGLDCRYLEDEGRPVVEFTWSGVDDNEPACGRGWARLERGVLLVGRIFIHCGDDSSFTARRFERPHAPKRAFRYKTH